MFVIIIFISYQYCAQSHTAEELLENTKSASEDFSDFMNTSKKAQKENKLIEEYKEKIQQNQSDIKKLEKQNTKIHNEFRRFGFRKNVTCFLCIENKKKNKEKIEENERSEKEVNEKELNLALMFDEELNKNK